MVSGLEFLRMVCAAAEPSTSGFTFDPFADDERHITNNGFHSALEFSNFGRDPRPAPRPVFTFHHPRPVRKHDLRDARKRLEDIAQSMERDREKEMAAISAARHPEPLAPSPADHFTLPASQHVAVPAKKDKGKGRQQDEQQMSPGVPVTSSRCAPYSSSVWALTPEEQQLTSTQLRPSASGSVNPSFGQASTSRLLLDRKLLPPCPSRWPARHSPAEQSHLPLPERVIAPPKLKARQEVEQKTDTVSVSVTPHSIWAMRPDELQRRQAPPARPPVFSLGRFCSRPPSPMPSDWRPSPVRERKSEGLACLSPGFLDHFPRYQSNSERARYAQGPPRPTFVLRRAPARAETSYPSPVPTIPSEYDSVNEREDGMDGQMDGELSEEGELRIDFNFFDEEYGRPSPLSLLEDDPNVVDEAEEYTTASEGSEYSDEPSDEEYYTPSEDWEYPDYHSDDDWLADDENENSPQLAPAVASSTLEPTPLPHSPISSIDSTSTSSAASNLSSNSETLHVQESLTAAEPKVTNPVAPHRWMTGMSGECYLFLIAAGRAIQRQRQVGT